MYMYGCSAGGADHLPTYLTLYAKGNTMKTNRDNKGVDFRLIRLYRGYKEYRKGMWNMGYNKAMSFNEWCATISHRPLW